MNRLETRLKANRERKAAKKQERCITKTTFKITASKQPIGEVQHKAPAALARNKQASAAMHKIADQVPKPKKKEYNPPDHNLTDAEALTFHKMYIRAHDQETVSGYLPQNMHIDSRGGIRYKRGQAPNALKQLKKNHGRFKDNPQDLYNNININNSNGRNNSLKGLKTLKRYYQERLNTTGKITLDGKEYEDKWGKLLTIMQIHMLKKLIQKPDSFELANRILTDLRLNAGEIPAQEIDVDVKQSHYHEFDLTGLLEQAGQVLERHQTPQIADTKADKAIEADYEVLDNSDNSSNNRDITD